MLETVIAVGVAFLVGLALGYKLSERLSQPVMDDYERLLRREAREISRDYLSRQSSRRAGIIRE